MNGGTGDYWWEYQDQYVPPSPWPQSWCPDGHDYQARDEENTPQCVQCGAIPWGRCDGEWYQ